MAYFGGNFQADIGAAKKCDKNEAFLVAIRGPKRGSPGTVVGRSQFVQELPEIADQPLGVNGALVLDHNRG